MATKNKTFRTTNKPICNGLHNPTKKQIQLTGRSPDKRKTPRQRRNNRRIYNTPTHGYD